MDIVLKSQDIICVFWTHCDFVRHFHLLDLKHIFLPLLIDLHVEGPLDIILFLLST